MSIEKDYSIELAAKKEGSEEEEGHLTVDILRDGNDILVQSTIAGADHKDIDISITNDRVTIRGHRDRDIKVKDSDFYHQELYWGPFSRSIILPEDIDSDKAKASMKNGLLTIRLPILGKKSKK